jgi:hypothetical protein
MYFLVGHRANTIERGLRIQTHRLKLARHFRPAYQVQHGIAIDLRTRSGRRLIGSYHACLDRLKRQHH